MAGIVVLAAAYVISHFYRSFLAVLSPQLTADLGMSPAAQSDALGAWFAAFAFSQFLVGVMLDRFGPRLTTALLFGVLGGGGGLLFAMAGSGTMVLVAMIALGIGCSPVLMASVYLFKRNYDGKQFATLTSTFIAVGMVGNILGSSPLAWGMETFGWRSVMMALCGTTIVLSLLVVILVTDPPRITVKDGTRGGYLDILKLPELWFILPLIFVNYGVVGGLRGIWAGPYFELVHGFKLEDLGAITFWMAIAMAAGSFAYGPVDRLLNSRKWVVLGGGSISLLCLAWWAFHPIISSTGVASLLVVMGFFSLYYGVLMAHATANVPAHLAGRGVTLVNFFNMGGVGVMQLLSSEVYRRNASVEVPVEGFNGVIWFYLCVFALALLLYAFSRDAKPNG